MCCQQLVFCDFVAVMQKPVGLQKLADEILSSKDTVLLEDILGVKRFLQTARASVWKTDTNKFSPPAMGSENLGRGGVVAPANMMQQSSCTTLFQGRGKMLQTWMSSAAGFLLFSKCFWRCCSWTFSASPDPKMPWKDKVMQDFRHFLLRTEGINCKRMQDCGWRWLHGMFVPSPCLSCCSTHGTGVVMILSRTTGHTKSFQGPQQASWMSTAFPSWWCPGAVLLSITTETLLAWYKDYAKLYFGSGSASVKLFPSLDLEEKYPKIWAWDSFCCYSTQLSQILSHSYQRMLQTKGARGGVRWVKF